ncbi:MAG: alpha/beta hydrolase [Candidatus Melainabacteria bacterium]|nr:alpha/beta hydrolase [Candidatus Melainabacteria bacterium]
MQLEVYKYGLQQSRSRLRSDVILIHGTGANASLWHPQVELITKLGYRCFVPELRGHGSSSEPGEPTNLAVHIEDVLESLEYHGISYPAIWVGHSLGAIISLLLAEASPQLFQQILAVSVPARVLKVVSCAFSFLMTWPVAAIKGTIVHKNLPRRERILVDTDQHSLRQIVTNFSRINLLDRDLSVKCPVHLSVGRLDVVAPYFYVEKLHKALPNSTFRIFEWAGHCCMEDQPKEFNQWLLEKMVIGNNGLISTG